jgi:hypothetical protein
MRRRTFLRSAAAAAGLFQLSEIGLLGMIAIRMGGMKLTYDGDAMRFANSEAANRLMIPPCRSGWKL